MRHQQFVIINIQQFAKSLAVLAYRLIIVTTISVDVPFPIASLAIATKPCAAESYNITIKVVEMQFWSFHLLPF